MKRMLLIVFGTALLAATACSTTKTVTANEKKEESAPPPPPKEVKKKKYLSKPGCVKWDDLPAAQKDEAENNYVIYRNRLKVKDIKGAYEFWQKVYKTAPAADGMRKTVFLDGVQFNLDFYKQTQDTAKQRQYVNQIKRLYQEAIDCYGEAGYIHGLLGFDLYYNLYAHATDQEKYHHLKIAIDSLGEKTPAFVINPFTALLIDLYLKKQISQAEANKYATLIPRIIDYGLTKSDEKESFKIVADYAPARLEELEGVKGFYGCDYYKRKYLDAFRRNPTNCDTIMMVFSRFNWGGCSKDDPDFKAVSKAYAANCQVSTGPSVTGTVGQAYQALREGRYHDAVRLFDQAISETDDSQKKAKYALVNAKIYFSYLKRFSKSREYARKAAKFRPGWGDPYLLIGRLYASSGPLCGPGRGWDSQIVTWPAIDMWNKAKSVDPSVAAQANKLIREYQRYMPSREEIFQRGYKEGQKFKVPCWIGVTTTIRAAP